MIPKFLRQSPPSRSAKRLAFENVRYLGQTGGKIVYLRLLARLSHIFWVVVCGMLVVSTRNPWHEAALTWGEPFLVSGFVVILVFQCFGFYGSSLFSRRLHVFSLITASLGGFLVVGLVRLLSPALLAISYAQFACWFGLSLFSFLMQHLVVRLIVRWQVDAGKGLESGVIVGRTENGNWLADFVGRHPDVGHRIIGYVDDRASRLNFAMAGLPYLGHLADLENMVRQDKVRLILLALPWGAIERMGEIIQSLRRLPVTLLLVPDMAAFRFAHNRISSVAGLPMFNISDLPLRGWEPFIKRLEDLVLGGLALLILSPLMLFVAVLIKLDSPGPVLFRQLRYGYNNSLIEVYKFRSMYADQTDPNAERQTTQDDDRITRVGRFIRRASIDELPQLLNVLGGSMSMVGPRPHATATKAAGKLFEDIVDEYVARHKVKPGITGWAQVNGLRGETDTEEKIEKRVACDLEYIENWSLWFDLYILALTPAAVVSGESAY